jgi:transcription elongation factor GreA
MLAPSAPDPGELEPDRVIGAFARGFGTFGVSRTHPSGREATMHNDTLLTPEGLEALQAELEELKARRPDMAAKIKSARELGDLKENAEYHAAKEEQGFLETRIQVIEGQLRTAKVVDASSSDRVTVGSTVVVRDLDAGGEETWTVTGVAEADPLENKVSYESPIGSALMDAAVGDRVEVQLPRGSMQLELVSIG